MQPGGLHPKRLNVATYCVIRYTNTIIHPLMKLHLYVQTVLAFRCIPAAVSRYIAEAGARLTPSARRKVADRLQRHEQKHVSLLDDGISKLTRLSRALKTKSAKSEPL